jgi:hypothetical protein
MFVVRTRRLTAKGNDEEEEEEEEEEFSRYIFEKSSNIEFQ